MWICTSHVTPVSIPCFYYTKGSPTIPNSHQAIESRGRLILQKHQEQENVIFLTASCHLQSLLSSWNLDKTPIPLHMLSFLHKIFSSFHLANHFCTAFDTFCFVFLLVYTYQILDMDYSFLPFNTNVTFSQRPTLTLLSTFVTQSHPLYNFELAPWPLHSIYHNVYLFAYCPSPLLDYKFH